MDEPLIDRLRNKKEIAERIYSNVVMVKGKGK
jgi:hypothetical protein